MQHPLSTPIGAPLTEAQLGLWYAQRLDPANPIFNIGHYTVIDGPLRADLFRDAVDAALAEADALACRVVETADGPRQVLDEGLRPRLALVDLRHLAQPESAALADMRQDLGIARDPVLDACARHVLYRVGEQRYFWYQRVHHVFIDGYGIALVDARAARLYAYATGEAVDAGDALAPYADALGEDAAYRQSEQRVRDQAYWQKAFADLPTVTSLAEGVPLSEHRALYASVRLPAEIGQALDAVQARTDVAWPDILTTLCGAYLCRHTGQPEAVLGVPYMGRLGNRTARVPAMVMNVVPLRLRIDEDTPADALLGEAARTLRQARRHGRYRSEQLRRDLGLLGGTRRLYGPLVNVLPFEAVATLPGLRTELHVLCAGPVEDLTLTFRGTPASGILLSVEANPALYPEGVVGAHLSRLAHFLAGALHADDLAGVPTLTPSERQRWLVDVNDTAHAVPRTTLAALIEETMHRCPEAVALTQGGRDITYAELERCSRELAARLQAASVRRGERVAIAMQRSPEMVIALVAVLRAGAAYLPLDIQHPPARLGSLVGQATPRAVIADAAGRAALPQDVATLATDGPAPAWDLGQAPTPDDPAYVLFTSGSTGTPKGVVIAHDAIVNRLLWMREHYGIDASERILQKTPSTFDVSVWEFFLPLLCGATLVVAPPEAHRDPAWLARLLVEERVSTLHFVPSMLAAFLAEPAARGLALRRVFCSGEALPAALRERFHTTLSAELHNLYGPTEAAVDVTWWPAGRDDASDPVPIGMPVWNTAMYVLDERLRPVPPGVAGHLYIAGRQLAIGYLGQPELTAQRFITDPFGAPGARMYATGDLARRREDGALVFLGRSDHQVKIRGQRIELGEIESVLAHAPGVDSAAVLVHGEATQARLVAYLVARPDAPADETAVRAHAAAHLPAVMQPGAYVWLAALPVTANGKLDRKALPTPAHLHAAGRVPETDREMEVAALFARILQTPAPVGADDDFFALGGHSLLAAQLALAIRQELGRQCTLGAVFEHATVAALAAYLDAQPGERDDGPAAQDNAGFGPRIALRRTDNALPALFCVHPAGGLSWCYGNLARAVAPARNVYGLQAPALEPARQAALPASLASMAAEYVDLLLQTQPQGPYHLLGWSVGGIIAQAMAVELRRRGARVGVLALLDAYPADVWRGQPEPPPEAFYKALLHIAGHDPALLPDVALNHDGVIGFLRRSGHPLGELPPERLDGVIRTVAGTNRLVRTHSHQRYDGRVLYFRAALDHVGENLTPAQWSPYVGMLDAHDVQALHAQLTGAQATAAISPILNAALLAADAEGGR
ncbi:amino acid adenylation domain-containing protein [Verticiella sediminum]|uniref:Amino acid adenylation domain-containing protein n=1 Tax=Verticiella sediminum TaxID=1247510 RepID=A0A556A5U7_9BURK|nr:non-ribosomal peptide synthetase [Verticiella sediminum]TSH88260.1 amino acid adenylation domain-containing protein [Verticiella sediminum]